MQHKAAAGWPPAMPASEDDQRDEAGPASAAAAGAEADADEEFVGPVPPSEDGEGEEDEMVGPALPKTKKRKVSL